MLIIKYIMYALLLLLFVTIIIISPKFMQLQVCYITLSHQWQAKGGPWLDQSISIDDKLPITPQIKNVTEKNTSKNDQMSSCCLKEEAQLQQHNGKPRIFRW